MNELSWLGQSKGSFVFVGCFILHSIPGSRDLSKFLNNSEKESKRGYTHTHKAVTSKEKVPWSTVLVTVYVAIKNRKHLFKKCFI